MRFVECPWCGDQWEEGDPEDDGPVEVDVEICPECAGDHYVNEVSGP